MLKIKWTRVRSKKVNAIGRVIAKAETPAASWFKIKRSDGRTLIVSVPNNER